MHDEILRLRSALRDLVALSTIPAAWVGREPSTIAAGLADVLVGSLQVDFALVRLGDLNGGGAVDVTRGHGWSAFPEWLQRHVATTGRRVRAAIVPDVGGAERRRGLVMPVGVNAECGLVVVASDRAEFPTETDHLLLSVAVNQAATAFQSARLVQERRRVEEALRQARDELEMKVTARTIALQRSEAHLAEAQRLSHIGSWARDMATGRQIHSSDEHSRLFGFDPQRDRPSADDFRQRIHPEDRARVADIVENATLHKTDYETEYRVVLPDGALRCLHTVGHPVLDAAGNLVEFVGTAMDVTERRQAEEDRQGHLWFLESMDWVNRAIQGTNDLRQMMSDVLDIVLAIFDCDRAWLVTPCDPEAASWNVAMEHTRAEFPGAFALGGDFPIEPEIADAFRTVRASNCPARFGSGSDHPLPGLAAKRFSVRSMMGMAIYPRGDKPYMLGIHQCSRPRVWTPQEERLLQEVGRRLEDALNSLFMFRNLGESERRLEQAQSISHVGYWERDLATDRYAWSDESYRIFGLAPQERIMTFDAIREAIHPADRQMMMAAVTKALESGSRYDLEYRAVRPNGEVRFVRSQGDVVRDESGRARRVFGTVQDLTELRHAEEALRRAQDELAHVTRMKTLGELGASIAHEINQPLTAIVADATASLNWLAKAEPKLDMVREALQGIVADGHRAGDVIQRIRQLATKSHPQKARLDTNDLIYGVVPMVRTEVIKHQVLLRLALASSLPPALGDRVQLQQVIINLVMNGVEAMAIVDDRPRELVIRSEGHDGDRVLVAVQDAGVGIDPRHVDRLFSAFFTTKPGGMGMGLSISRSIIEGHGGRLWATSNPKHGATFHFTLPVLR
jgi:PAS domain S-box-containing protein